MPESSICKRRDWRIDAPGVYAERSERIGMTFWIVILNNN